MDDKIFFRPATSGDSRAMRAVAQDTGVLSVNSTYYYALMARHFKETCMVAERGGKLCAYVTAYAPPGQPDTLFVWQVGVGLKWQGQGLGKRLLLALVSEQQPRFVEATIAPDNQASIKLFQAVARQLGADHSFSDRPFFADEELGSGEGAEHLMRVGPIKMTQSSFSYGGTHAHI